MLRVHAKIHLYAGEKKRKHFVLSGYRPNFSFVPESMTCGSITLLDREKLEPGSTGTAMIRFHSPALLGSEFGPGTKAEFFEGLVSVGEAEILEILESD